MDEPREKLRTFSIPEVFMSPSESDMVRTAGYSGLAWMAYSAWVLLAGAFTGQAEPLDEWHARASPLPDDAALRAIAFGNGRFVAVAYRDGHAITSPDGNIWTLQNTGAGETSDRLSSLTFGNGLFVGVGPGGHIRTSPDGVQWPQDGHVRKLQQRGFRQRPLPGDGRRRMDSEFAQRVN
jgi:hypothetical protein